MKILTAAVLATCLANSAMAQQRAGRPLPMPPPEYDKPYDGPMIVAHVDAKMMAQLCPRTIFDRTSRREVHPNAVFRD
jgi:hypothetical protein